MKQITIVIPFLNEGDEPIKTIKSIHETANPELFDVILVQDAPEDPPFDHTVYPNVRLIKNDKRYGCHYSRGVGIRSAETPFIMTMDAHMRFLNNGWMDTMLKHAKEEDKTMFCVVTRGVDPATDAVNPKGGGGYGCRILMKNSFAEKKVVDNCILAPKWLALDKNKGPCYEVPCLMGACYIMSRDWINHIRRQDGLIFWGSTEASMSLKTWLAGGKCKLLPDVTVGHVYRSGASLPYLLYNWYKIYNIQYLIEVLFPDHLVQKAVQHLYEVDLQGDIWHAKREIERNKNEIAEARKYYQSIMQHDIEWYCDYFKAEPFWREQCSVVDQSTNKHLSG